MLAGLPLDVTRHFSWHRFLVIQIWVVALFLIYTFIHELNTLFGDGELSIHQPTACPSLRKSDPAR